MLAIIGLKDAFLIMNYVYTGLLGKRQVNAQTI